MAIGTTAALLGSAAIGAAGSALGSKAQSKAADKAAGASQAATDATIAEQRRQFDIGQQNQQPWLQAGTQSVGHYANLLGLNGPEASANAQAVFQASPDYQFRLNESLRGLTARNAALGIQDSGAAQRSALTLAGNQASGEFGNYANRLAGLAGVGQTAAQNSAAQGANFANSMGNILGQNAQNLGSSYGQQGQASANMWGNLAGIGSGILGQFGGR